MATQPIWAKVDDTVEIHWRDQEGHIYVETRTCPPRATREAKAIATATKAIASEPAPDTRQRVGKTGTDDPKSVQ